MYDASCYKCPVSNVDYYEVCDGVYYTDIWGLLAMRTRLNPFVSLQPSDALIMALSSNQFVIPFNLHSFTLQIYWQVCYSTDNVVSGSTSALSSGAEFTASTSDRFLSGRTNSRARLAALQAATACRRVATTRATTRATTPLRDMQIRSPPRAHTCTAALGPRYRTPCAVSVEIHELTAPIVACCMFSSR